MNAKPASAREVARIINRIYHIGMTPAEVEEVLATVPAPLENQNFNWPTSTLEVTAEEEEAWQELARRVC